MASTIVLGVTLVQKIIIGPAVQYLLGTNQLCPRLASVEEGPLVCLFEIWSFYELVSGTVESIPHGDHHLKKNP